MRESLRALNILWYNYHEVSDRVDGELSSSSLASLIMFGCVYGQAPLGLYLSKDYLSVSDVTTASAVSKSLKSNG